jgi:hypothetical protein
MLREADMRVVETSDGWNVIGPGDMSVGPFATQAEAFRWLDNQLSRRYGA